MAHRRYVVRPNLETGEFQLVEVSRDWTDAPRSTGDLGKFEYDNCRATDGTDISSSSKLKRYLKETGQCLADDYRGEWKEAAEKREAFRGGEQRGSKERREALGREAYRRGLLK